MINNKDLTRSLERLTQIVERMTPPIAPIPAIPAIAPIPPLVVTGDHDLLIKLETKVDGLIVSVEGLSKRDSNYVLKEDFSFWRNLLVSGLLLTIFIGVVMNLIKK